MNKVFAEVGSQVYVLMNIGEEDEHVVELTLNGTPRIVPEYTEGFPISFTIDLPSSLAELNAQIKSDLRKSNGLRHYVKKITAKNGEKLERKWRLEVKRNMFKRKRKSFI